MKTFLLTAVMVIAVQEACAIKCLQCKADFDAALGGNLSHPVISNTSLCHNTTDTVDCSDLGSAYDSCGIASVRMNYSIFGYIKGFILNCSIKSSCSFQQLEGNMTCQQMKTSSLATSGINITSCGANCLAFVVGIRFISHCEKDKNVLLTRTKTLRWINIV
ncbi:unnamed protein product [Porites evermanni]|uniref:Sodefrin-like factor n=1 Tax=Porites evermanni TaxID=104178 RepID=A0ABN8LUF0_9CNID|nr:unnamed protein product [Porites evermanni]